MPSSPDVSIIVPAYNAMPYIRRTLQSLVDQTIGHERMEVVVVDDGSSDGTGDELERWSADHPGLFRIVHQEASGGPAGPRNVALDLARGRYVFFLDADDYLGVESLARLVAIADANSSDVVLGKMVGLGGRGVAQSMFRKSVAETDVFRSRVWWTLAVLKLYRRSFIEEHGLRFPTEFPTTSDQPFAGLAYLRAGTISIDADYDHYYVVRRDDGAHVTKSGNVGNRLDVYEWMCAMVAREVSDLDKREYLLSRHFSIELRRCLRAAARQQDPAARRVILDRVGALARTHLTPGLAARLNPRLRVALYLAGQGLVEETLRAQAEEKNPTPFDVIEEDGRWYARLPFFRDPDVPVPDHLFDVTRGGAVDVLPCTWEWQDATLTLTVDSPGELLALAEQGAVEMLARRRGKGAAAPVVAQVHRDADSVTASLDLLHAAAGSPLPSGTWNLYLRARRPGSTRVVKLGADPRADRGQGLVRRTVHGDNEFVATGRTGSNGSLVLAVRGTAPEPLPVLTPSAGLLRRFRDRVARSRR